MVLSASDRSLASHVDERVASPLAAGVSQCGVRHDVNQDAWISIPALGLVAVADGVGSRRMSDVAAREAVAAVGSYLSEREDALHIARRAADARALSTLLLDAVLAANSTVFELSRASEQLRGTACTLTALLIGTRRATIAHVGDSRAYIIRRGACHQLTRDHTAAEELLGAGVLTPDQADHHQFRGLLTRSIGQGPSVSVDVLELDVLYRDRFLLCSDGVTKTIVSPQELAGCIMDAPVSAAAEAVVALAAGRGERDDITAVVAEVGARRGFAGVTDKMRTLVAPARSDRFSRRTGG